MKNEQTLQVSEVKTERNGKSYCFTHEGDNGMETDVCELQKVTL